MLTLTKSLVTIPRPPKQLKRPEILPGSGHLWGQAAARPRLVIKRRLELKKKAPAKAPGRSALSMAGRWMAGARLVLPVQPDQLALNPDPVRRQDADLVGGVGGLQRD